MRSKKTIESKEITTYFFIKFINLKIIIVKNRSLILNYI